MEKTAVSLSQIKAARSLLGWTQEKLAEAAGLSLPSINNLERGLYSPRSETLLAIVAALESAGIEFTEQNGLRIRENDYDMVTFAGPHFVRDFDRDILSVLQSPKDEIIGVTCDDGKWMEYGSVSNPIYVAARKEKKWKERLLIPEDTRFITSPPQSYRTLPTKYFGTSGYEVYGNRLALIAWDAIRVTVIKNASIADAFKNQFEALWEMAKPFTAAQLKKIERLDLEKSG